MENFILQKSVTDTQTFFTEYIHNVICGTLYINFIVCVAEKKEFYLSTVLATYSCPVLSHYYLVLMNNYYSSPMAYLTWFSQFHFSERLAIA